MSENQENATRLEQDSEGAFTLVPGEDALGDQIRQMSEEQVQQVMEHMLVALRRASFRVIPGGAE